MKEDLVDKNEKIRKIGIFISKAPHENDLKNDE
jgi:hypothetical protein